MISETLFHLIDADPTRHRTFGAAARQLGLACHCYRDIDEFVARSRSDGLVLFHDDGLSGLPRELLERCSAQGRWPGVVAYAAEPDVERIVEAMKAGALSYHRTPHDKAAIAIVLDKAWAEFATGHAERREVVRAQANLERLSPRERQVLQGLVQGDSNKEIARVLNISPRTVEIHRMKMMGKIGARNSAEAIRLGLSAAFTNGWGTASLAEPLYVQ